MTDTEKLEDLIGKTATNITTQEFFWTIHAVRIDHHKEVFVELMRHEPGHTYRYWEPLKKVRVFNEHGQ